MSSRATRKAARREDESNGDEATPGRLYIDYMPLSELTSAKRNPKRHRLDTVEDSFRRFGFVEAPVIDERTGRLVAGHGRIEALRRRKAAGHAAPEGIEDRGDEWLIPVERGKRFASDAEAAAYLVASNRTSEIGGWDFPELNELAREIEATASEGLVGTGFTMSEIEAALEREVQEILGAGGHDPAAGVPSLDDLERQFGTETRDELFWPEIKVKVPKTTFERWKQAAKQFGKPEDMVEAMLDGLNM